MTTAFQANAFQNNAFQIDISPNPDCITLMAINFEFIAIILIGSSLLISILDMFAAS